MAASNVDERLFLAASCLMRPANADPDPYNVAGVPTKRRRCAKWTAEQATLLQRNVQSKSAKEFPVCLNIGRILLG